MSVEFQVRQHIAVGQKSSDDPGAYGRGFNYQVEASFAWSEAPEALEKHLSEVLKEIDHRHLGLDTAVISEPNTANICAWIFQRLQARGALVTKVKLLRGDGLSASLKVPRPCPRP